MHKLSAMNAYLAAHGVKSGAVAVLMATVASRSIGRSSSCLLRRELSDSHPIS